MAKPKRACSFPNTNGTCGFPLLRATLFVLLLLWALWYTRDQLTNLLMCPTTTTRPPDTNTATSGIVHDPPQETFYDDPELSYSIEKPLKNWDEKRSAWLRLHPPLADGARDRVLLVTGTQPSPCKNPVGDHLLLRSFKNKVSV